MKSKAIGLITANYKTNVPCALSKRRPMAGLPFAGRYRLIDFPLSNMVNAGIRTVGMIVPQNYRSLLDHVGTGRDWMLDRKNGGLFILPGTVYGGTHEGFRFLLRDIIDNKAFLIRDTAEYVVLSGSNMVVNFDLKAAIAAHEASGNTATIDQLNRYFQLLQMPIVTSRYWNIVHGATADEVERDAEGMQAMRFLGGNMVFLIKAIRAAREAGIEPPAQEPTTYTNFIR